VDREEQFDKAEREARVLMEAASAVDGATDGVGSPRDNVIILLRLNGHRQAVQCGHLTGPAPVSLHTAIRIHQCQACAGSDDTRERISKFRPIECDSCGATNIDVAPCQFTTTNVIVTAFICEACRTTPGNAVVPDWVRNL